MKQPPTPSLLTVLRTLGLRADDAPDEALSACEAAWLSGYFAALARDAYKRDEVASLIAPRAAKAKAPEPIRAAVLYGSETGNAKALATRVADRLRALASLRVEVHDLADYKARALANEQVVVVITSTHGDGAPPERATSFFEQLSGRSAPSSLSRVRFAVLGLGDSSYEHFCRAAKVVDARLAELGAERIVPRSDCDVEYEEAAAQWIDALVAAVGGADTPQAIEVASAPNAARTSSATTTTTTTMTYDKQRPFVAAVLENIRLTGRGSSKDVRHLSLDLADSGLAYAPGDAIAVLAPNQRSVVSGLIEQLRLSASDEVHVDGRPVTLAQALTEHLDVTVPSPRFLRGWAELSGAEELVRLCDDARSDERRRFLSAHHVLDVVRAYPARTLRADAFAALLRPLAPRSYSVASSQRALPSEVHLLVSVVRYQLNGRDCLGVASGHLGEAAREGEALRVFVQPNEGFRLPASDAQVVMIGAGTGVAPYRAFLQEREAEGRSTPSWLFFGERNFRTDFLYQIEWQAWLKSGALTRLTPAFSRDGAQKVYVQHRLREHGRELYDWLERGAHLYVCGDAAALAPAVHDALIAIVEEQVGSHDRALEYVHALREQRRYQRDVY